MQIQIEGIKEGIGSDIELDYEFMDTKRVDDVESRRLPPLLEEFWLQSIFTDRTIC